MYGEKNKISTFRMLTNILPLQISYIVLSYDRVYNNKSKEPINYSKNPQFKRPKINKNGDWL